MGVHFSFHLPKTPSAASLLPELNFKVESSEATVLLIHGLTGTPNEMKHLASYLSRQGYSVICPRLARHGEPLRILKYAKWKELYQSVRKSFLEISPDQKIFVAGLSAGALLALLLAEEFPEKVAGVSCLSPTLFYDGWKIPWTHHLLPLAYYTPIRHFLYFKEEPPYGIKNKAIQKKIHAYYQKASLTDDSQVERHGYPYYPVTLFCELRHIIKEVKRKLPRIHQPVQLIQAYEDDMTSVKNSQYIYDHIGSREKEIVLLYDSYHVITADQEREKVSKNTTRFFDRVRQEMSNQIPKNSKGNLLCSA